jgi:hypothetical protein
VPYAQKFPGNHVKRPLLRVRACSVRRRENWPGFQKSARSETSRTRRKARNSRFRETRRSCSSRPGEAAWEVAYRYGAASTSNLRKNCRDREGFRVPENRLVTGDPGHEKPRKGPETRAVRPKIPRKKRQTSPTTSSCRFGKAPQKLAWVPKIGPERDQPYTKEGPKQPFPRNQA